MGSKREEQILFRIKNKVTGLFFQRSGGFGKLPRHYPTIGQLRLSILESNDH